MFVFKAIFVTEFFNYIWIFSTFNLIKYGKSNSMVNHVLRCH